MEYILGKHFQMYTYFDSRYQPPAGVGTQQKPKQANKSRRKRIDADKFESFGLRSLRTKSSKWKTHESKGFKNQEEKSLGQGKGSTCQNGRHTDPGPSGVR